MRFQLTKIVCKTIQASVKNKEMSRLNSMDLSVLKEIIKDGGNGKIEMYGHKILIGERVYELPWSDFFSIDRIRKLVSAVRGDSVRAQCLIAAIEIIHNIQKSEVSSAFDA